ncbi:MAG: hypothetical protein ABIO91_07580 [Pyrinomonadaceae bacterium]
MKRCPECRRSYHDDSLSFCLDDGTLLVDGPATDESATAIQPTRESKTVLMPATSDIGTPPTDNSISNSLSRRKTMIAALVVALMALAGGIGFAVYKFRTPEPAVYSPFQTIKIERLTSNGKATQAVISPDGKQVVYVLDDAGKRSLWLRQVATATDVQLTPPTNEVFYWSLTISRDGNYLYYVYGGTIRNRILYQMPLVGGAARKVIDDVGSPIGFSPDGSHIAFVRSRETESAMMIANADGTGEREIAKRPGQQSFGSLFWGGVAWSPDGKKIVSVANNPDAEGRFQNVVEVSVEDGTVRPLTSPKFYEIQRLAMLADGSGVLVTAAEKASEFRSRQIWYLPYPDGEARKITKDLNDYTSISMSSDSSVLVTVQEDEASNIWIAPTGDSSRAEQISAVSGRMDGYDGVSWTLDGRIVYTSMAGGNEAIWIMDADGKNRKQLSAGESADFWPSVSADGRYIVFTAERGRVRSIWRMDIDGSNRIQLSDRGGGIPQGTADWVYFGDVWKVPINGGERVRVADERGLNRCSVSPNGKLLACQLDPPGEDAKIKVISSEDGATIKVFDVKLELPARIRWSPDGRSITYISRLDGLRDIWSQPIDGGEPKRLTNFKADQIFSFNWSRDNRLVISHGRSDSDVVLIRNTK